MTFVLNASWRYFISIKKSKDCCFEKTVLLVQAIPHGDYCNKWCCWWEIYWLNWGSRIPQYPYIFSMFESGSYSMSVWSVSHPRTQTSSLCVQCHFLGSPSSGIVFTIEWGENKNHHRMSRRMKEIWGWYVIDDVRGTRFFIWEISPPLDIVTN